MERGKMSYEKRRMGETEELDYQVLHVNWWVFKGTGEFCFVRKGRPFMPLKSTLDIDIVKIL